MSMAIKELNNNGIFWICYLSAIVAIALIPLYVNKYYFKKYKMSFSEYNRQFIDSFCNNDCIYAAEFSDLRSTIRVLILPLCILMTCAIISQADESSTFRLWTGIVANIILHISSILYSLECIFAACFMTKESMLIRGFCTKNIFKIVPLQDIISYWPAQAGAFGLSDTLDIATKNGDAFHLYNLKNRDQLIDILKDLTNATNLAYYQ